MIDNIFFRSDLLDLIFTEAAYIKLLINDGKWFI